MALPRKKGLAGTARSWQCPLRRLAAIPATARPALIACDLKGVMSLPHVVSTITSGSMAISAADSPVVYRRDVTVPAYGWCHGGAGWLDGVRPCWCSG